MVNRVMRILSLAVTPFYFILEASSLATTHQERCRKDEGPKASGLTSVNLSVPGPLDRPRAFQCT